MLFPELTISVQRMFYSRTALILQLYWTKHKPEGRKYERTNKVHALHGRVYVMPCVRVGDLTGETSK